MNYKPWAIVTPMANEEKDFFPFVRALQEQLRLIPNGKVFLVVDKASTDNTLQLCIDLGKTDPSFITVWAPENKNVVDAYLRGYKESLKSDAEYIIEMDAGLSHDPAELPNFLKKLDEGFECVYGSRFMKGGSIDSSHPRRHFLSKAGTVLSNVLLGTKLKDMTSGYQGFHRRVVENFLKYDLLSRAHFYQTELKYLLRKYRSVEIPIIYKAPSPRVSRKAIKNSITTLLHYFSKRITFRSVSL
jgi:dolichol-phosphate mannosyltransferase